MRRKIREKGEFERTRERKEKELEVQAHDFYFYKVFVPYNHCKEIGLVSRFNIKLNEMVKR